MSNNSNNGDNSWVDSETSDLMRGTTWDKNKVTDDEQITLTEYFKDEVEKYNEVRINTIAKTSLSNETNLELEYTPVGTVLTNLEYVIPLGCDHSLYDGDYILSPVVNYGIIKNNSIDWYEIGTNVLVSTTKNDPKIYKHISKDHINLIQLLGNLNIDVITLIGLRDDSYMWSKLKCDVMMKAC